MRSIFLPGIALINLLRYPGKFALISALTLIPLIVTCYLLVDQLGVNLVLESADDTLEVLHYFRYIIVIQIRHVC